MGAHETLEAALERVETDALRIHALTLVTQAEADANGTTPMDRGDWIEWEGRAYALLRELARG